MSVQVETLEKLERRITLTLPTDTIASEVESRLKRLARTVKADGFRPGKVPMSVVAQRYGYSVHYEVMNDKVGEQFNAAVNEAKLRVAGAPRITEKDGAPEGQVAFDATFEVYPEVKIGDLAGAEVERVSTEVTDAAIDKTLDILRKQRRTFQQRAAADGAAEGDRVTIDFEGKIDGVPFEGGKAEAFQFIIGEGQMLEQFDQAVRGMKAGESKTFPLQFPADYHGKDVAGKEADFLVTLKKVEAQHLRGGAPALGDDALVPSVGAEPVAHDLLARAVAQNQPLKLAALEGHYHTQARAPLHIGGWPDTEARVTRYALKIPAGLSLLAAHDPDARVQGLDDFPRADWPNVAAVHISFQIMVMAGGAMTLPPLLGALLWLLRRRLGRAALATRWYLWLVVLCAPLGMIAIETGWATVAALCAS